MPKGMPRHLFVYGTLRRGSSGLMASQLHAATTWVGPAKARGVLYDFGSFPGAVFDPTHPGLIVGEVFGICSSYSEKVTGFLAQMLGGDTKTSRAHARELMRATATLAKKSKRRS